MDLKAKIDKDTFGYRNRLILIALGALSMHPCVSTTRPLNTPSRSKHANCLRMSKEHPSDWKDHWPAVAKANDLDPNKEPKERSEGDITTQWWQFAVVFPIGTYCLISVLVWSRRFIGADESTLYARAMSKSRSTRSASTRPDGKTRGSLVSTTTLAQAKTMS